MKYWIPAFLSVLFFWGCGDDTGSDDDTTTCTSDNTIDHDHHTCDEDGGSNSYSESVSSGIRTIVTNGIPTHQYRIQIPEIVSALDGSTKTYKVTAVPSKATSTTSLDNGGHPQYKFGVAANGVALDPAPAEPFVFENTSTGQYNWDWVMEPNNNMDAVGLDCAIAHVQPDGLYHYHGDMAIFADQLLSGLGDGTTTPSTFVQIGWAADGFPVLYKYGPDGSGNIVKLTSSYQLKSGERPGDGITEPCGEYSGKYTNDYEYISGAGDLDACNGITRNITIGAKTFTYFYVVTDDFPIIPRCFVGTPHTSFKIGG